MHQIQLLARVDDSLAILCLLGIVSLLAEPFGACRWLDMCRGQPGRDILSTLTHTHIHQQEVYLGSARLAIALMRTTPAPATGRQTYRWANLC